jgi:ABC-type multidrug transport system fused ATPase/permease subunit
MLTTVLNVIRLLDAGEKRQLALLMAGMAVVALIEACGVSSILPFISVVADPAMIQGNGILRRVYAAGGFTAPHRFLFALGGLVFGLLVLNNICGAAMTWLLLRFANRRMHTLSVRLLSGYLRQPYSFFLTRNTAELARKTLTQASRAVSGVLLPALTMFARAMQGLFIFSLLLVADAGLAFTVALVLGGAYAVIYRSIRARLGRIGRISEAADKLRFKNASEALAGIKEILLLGRQHWFVARYEQASLAAADADAGNQALAQLPRYALEVLTFGGILAIVLYYIGQQMDVSKILPLLALYVFAGYRLMPALQQIFSNLATIRYNIPAFEALSADLEAVGWQVGAAAEPEAEGALEPLRLTREMRFEQVGYTYAEAAQPVLRGLSLTLPANATIGVVGSTGAGKTTLVNLVLGLLEPGEGTIRIDGEELTATNRKRWQRNVGYVPQDIYLTDDTVARNIALGLPDHLIDRAAVERAARAANLHGFVTAELPQGYDTPVGDRGVRLSGGQRQRIGIARALYHDPAMLVMDEATSALDNLTEVAIMEAIHNLARRKTIVLVAHRLSTVRKCDTIFLLEAGRLAAQGTYDDLLRESDTFHRMAHGKSAASALDGARVTHNSMTE